MALMILIVLGPYQLLNAFILSRMMPDVGAFGTTTGTTDPMMAPTDMFGPGLAVASILVTLVGMVVYTLVGGALVWMVRRDDRGGEATWGQSLGGALRRAWPLLGGGALVGLGLIAGAIVLVLLLVLVGALALPLAILLGIPLVLIGIPAVTAVATMVVPVAIMEPQAGAVDVATRAVTLTLRRFWRMTGVMALVLLVLMVVTFAVSLVLGVLALLAGPVQWVVDGLGQAGISIVTMPVVIFSVLLLYLDARVRLEGWDLEVRAQRPGPW